MTAARSMSSSVKRRSENVIAPYRSTCRETAPSASRRPVARTALKASLDVLLLFPSRAEVAFKERNQLFMMLVLGRAS
jgi:hypothetical protein